MAVKQQLQVSLLKSFLTVYIADYYHRTAARCPRDYTTLPNHCQCREILMCHQVTVIKYQI